VAGLAEPAHVLAWMPPWLLPWRDRTALPGWWEIVTVAGFDGYADGSGTGVAEAGLDRDTHPVLLAARASAEIGADVWLARSRRWRGRRLPWRPEPVYLAYPGGWAS
jgi:hypothetical protein